jgi:hypothetical protein
MVTILTGVPGSGKTHEAVRRILYYKDKSTLITNIPLNDSPLLSHFDIINFQVSEFDYDCKLVDEAIQGLLDDVELNNKVNYKDALFVLDEAQSVFYSSERSRLMWVSYHRHLDLDVLLLTQSVSNFSRKFLGNFENFEKVFPSSQAVSFSKNIYEVRQYSKSSMRPNYMLSSFKEKYRDDVFELYSTAKGSHTNRFYLLSKFKYLFLLAFFLIFSAVLLISTSDILTSEDTEDNQALVHNEDNQVLIYNEDKEQVFDTSLKSIEFTCELGYCESWQLSGRWKFSDLESLGIQIYYKYVNSISSGTGVILYSSIFYKAFVPNSAEYIFSQEKYFESPHFDGLGVVKKPSSAQVSRPISVKNPFKDN